MYGVLMPVNQKSEPRSLTARGAATRARIVEAAADLIYAHGVEQTSLDDVMAASGVSKSQLYHYFADKDALVLDVIARQTERVLDAQRPIWRRWIRCLPSRLGATPSLSTNFNVDLLKNHLARLLANHQQRPWLGGQD